MPSAKLDRWLDRLERVGRETIEEIADVGETVTRDNRGWQDDTHSAEESITGFEVKYGDPERNFHAVNWTMAQKVGSRKYGTPKKNFMPVKGTSVRFDDKDEVAVITGWTRYLPILEDSARQGTHTFERSIHDMVSVGDRIVSSTMRKV